MRLPPLRVLCLIVLVAAGACGGSSARMEKLSDDAVILAFGDSLTYGTGAAKEDSYPARGIKRKVVNAGVPGETSAAGLERLGEVLEAVKPALLILCHSGNDSAKDGRCQGGEQRARDHRDGAREGHRGGAARHAEADAVSLVLRRSGAV